MRPRELLVRRTTRTALILLVCLGLAVPVSFAVREAVEWVSLRTGAVTDTVQEAALPSGSRAEAEREARRIARMLDRSKWTSVRSVTPEEDLSGIRVLVSDPDQVTDATAECMRTAVDTPMPVRLEFQGDDSGPQALTHL